MSSVILSQRFFPERALWDLDRDLQKPRKSEPQVVIVGPSYARAIGKHFGYNFAINGVRSSECAFIINHYCRPDDLVVFIITINEIGSSNQPLRKEIKSRPFRLLTITKGAIRAFLDPESVEFVLPKSNIDKAEFIECADFAHEPDLYMDYIGFQLIYFSQIAPQDIDLNFFVELYKNHPNILFVIHPTLPRKVIQSRNQTAKKINVVYASRQRFRSLFEQSKLPHIDLSDDVEPENFHDLVHLDEHGVEVVTDILKDYLNRNYETAL